MAATMYDLSLLGLASTKASKRHEVVPGPREGGGSLRRSIAQVESLDTTEKEEIRK